MFSFINVVNLQWHTVPLSWLTLCVCCSQVCVKGPNVFQGYLQDPEQTSGAVDKAGWLHTGDIGKWLPVNSTYTFSTVFTLSNSQSTSSVLIYSTS